MDAPYDANVRLTGKPGKKVPDGQETKIARPTPWHLLSPLTGDLGCQDCCGHEQFSQSYELESQSMD